MVMNMEELLRICVQLGMPNHIYDKILKIKQLIYLAIGGKL